MSYATKHDVKARCIVDLIERLRGGAVLTTPEIAASYGVCQRTAQRWLLVVETIVPLAVTVGPEHVVRYRLMRRTGGRRDLHT